MWINVLLKKRDLLTPYFKFKKELRGNMESVLLENIFKLRYEVYCLECQFLAIDDFKNGQETDEYDGCSTHFAAFTLDDSIIATVRLVQPGQEQNYPFESHCSVFDTYLQPPREETGEVSRLIVKKSYRRRQGDSMQGVTSEFREKGKISAIKPHHGGRKRDGESPMLLLGLYREMYRYSKENGIRWWYAAMENSVARSLGKIGFEFLPIGPQTDYYGPVTPYVVNVDEVHHRLQIENKLLAAWFNDERIPFSVLIESWLSQFLRRFKSRK